MTNAPVEPRAKNDPTVEPRPAVSRLKGLVPAVGEPVSITANVIAAIGSFLFLITAPTILLNFVPLPEEFATILAEFMPMALSEITTTAFGIALLFLVIGICFQLWQSCKGLSSWWPLALAFPVTAIVLVPDALAHGGPLSAWAELALAIALAFCAHWLAVLAIRELMD